MNNDCVTMFFNAGGRRMRMIPKLLAFFCGGALFLSAGDAVFAANPGGTISGNSSSPVTVDSGTETITNTGVLSVANSVSGSDAITVTGNSTIVNSGTIKETTTGGNAGRSIYVNTKNLTIIITNNAGALIQAADFDPIQVNKGSDSVLMNNYGSVISLNASAGGAQAIDWNAISSGSNTLNNFSTGILQATNADAVRPGMNGVVNNSGLIQSISSIGSSSDGIDAQTNTGIVINNLVGGTVEGARHGITGGNTTSPGTYSMTITNQAGATIKGDDGSGVNIDGINGSELVTITNSGTIVGNGQSGDGDGVDVDGLVNLANTGIIKSVNSTGTGGNIEHSEGVTVGGGTFTNSGTIEGDVANGNTTAVGRGMTFAGVDKDASGNSIPVQAIYGNVSGTNSGLIKGQSDSAIAIQGPKSGFTVNLTNLAGGTIEGGGATAAAILGSDDNTTITNSGTIMADSSNQAITFGNGNNALNILGGAASIVGNITGGTGTNSMTINPGTGNTFNYSGSISNFHSVQVQSGTVALTGTSSYTGATSVTGGKLVVNGSISASSGVSVSSGASVGGSGKVGAISGAGTVEPGNSPGILTASSVDLTSGLSFKLELGVAGIPTWSNSLTSGNDVLRLSAGTPIIGTATSTNVFDIYLTTLNAGTYVGGIFTDKNTDFASLLSGATYHYYVLDDAHGSVAYNGHSYDVVSSSLVTASTVLIANANFGTGADNVSGGYSQEFTVVPEPRTYIMLIGGFAVLVVCTRFRRKNAANS